MHDLHSPAQMVLEELSCQSAVALVRSCLAAEQASAIQGISREEFLYVSLADQIVIGLCIGFPCYLAFFIALEHVVGWCQLQSMVVAHASNLFQKEGKVILLREASQLRYVVQAGVEHSLDAAFLNQLKELPGILFCETNREDLDGLAHVIPQAAIMGLV